MTISIISVVCVLALAFAANALRKGFRAYEKVSEAEKERSDALVYTRSMVSAMLYLWSAFVWLALLAGVGIGRWL